MKNNCLRFALFLYCILLVNLGDSYGANPEIVGPPFKFNGIETDIPIGTIGCVQFEIEGFEDVLSFQLGFQYDSSILRFDNITSSVLAVGTDLLALDAVNADGEDFITVLYTNFLGSATFPDGTIIFELCFEAIGDIGDSVIITLDDEIANGQPSQVFTTMGSFTVPDLCGTNTETEIVDVIPTIDVMPTITPASCQSSEDGSISLDLDGGIEPYNVLVEDCITGDIVFGPQDVGTAVAISNTLNPGDYCVTVTDSGVPSLTTTLTLTVDNNGPSLGADFDLTEPLCNGQMNGSIEAFAILDAFVQPNPNPDFSFLWTMTGGAGTVVGPVLSNIGAGNYEVQITENSSGCFVTQSIFLTEPAAFEVDIEVTNETCLGNGMDGTATAVTSGGVGPFDFQWDDPMNSTSSMLTGLSAANYTVVVRDANNCPAMDTEAVTVPDPPIIMGFDSVSVSCPGRMDGQLSVLFADGSAMVNDIVWTLPDMSTQNGAILNNIGAGLYTVTLTAVDNCSSSMTVNLGEADGLEIDLVNSTVTNPECTGGTDGSIIVVVNGGVAPFTYTFEGTESSGPNGLIFSQLDAGEYTVSVTDANGCDPVSTVFVVEDPEPILVEFIDLTGVPCFGQPPSTGSATAIPSGGNGTYIFTWESGEMDFLTTQSTANFLMGDTQTLQVISGNCAIDTFVIIDQPDEILIEIQDQDLSNVSCFGESDGSIELTVSGGTGDFTFDWGVNGTTNPLTNISAGIFTVTVRDDNNCAETISIEVAEPDSLDAFIIDVDDVSCNGEADGLLASAFEGGTGSVSYQWSTSAADTFSTVTALGAGDFIVTVTDSNGCIDTAMATVIEPSPIVAAVFDPPPARCFGEQTEITVANVTGGNGGPYRFTVNAGPSVPVNNSVPVFAGEFTVSIFDSRGCRVALPVVATEPPPVTVTATAEPVINLGGSTFVFAFADSEVGIDSIFWIESPGDSTLSCYDCLDPIASPLEDSQYELFAVDANGCVNSTVLLIDVDSDRNVFIPNVFTPNIDGINDVFSPFTGVGVSEVSSFDIYDRWGEIVFSLDSFLPGSSEAFGWDGTFRGEDASPGVYFYLIRVEFVDGVSLLFRGDVTLIRE